MFRVGFLQVARKTSLQVEPFLFLAGETLFITQIYSHELIKEGKEKQESRSYPFNKLGNCITRTQLLKWFLLMTRCFFSTLLW